MEPSFKSRTRVAGGDLMPGVEKEEEALLNEEPEFPIPEVAEVVQTAEERQFLDSVTRLDNAGLLKLFHGL